MTKVVEDCQLGADIGEKAAVGIRGCRCVASVVKVPVFVGSLHSVIVQCARLSKTQIPAAKMPGQIAKPPST